MLAIAVLLGLSLFDVPVLGNFFGPSRLVGATIDPVVDDRKNFLSRLTLTSAQGTVSCLDFFLSASIFFLVSNHSREYFTCSPSFSSKSSTLLGATGEGVRGGVGIICRSSLQFSSEILLVVRVFLPFLPLPAGEMLRKSCSSSRTASSSSLATSSFEFRNSHSLLFFFIESTARVRPRTSLRRRRIVSASAAAADWEEAGDSSGLV
mmetsp:Transcript_10275/g.16974  ORF Transcript_10275/g.16974 Transcript_10275/m.16974 type:complete len:207 (-) Transcript_10275:168-788(-)